MLGASLKCLEGASGRWQGRGAPSELRLGSPCTGSTPHSPHLNADL